MKMTILIPAALAAMLPVTALPGRQRGGETIVYRTGPCMRYCPIYSVTVRADGSGVFNGEDYTAVRGEHPFRVSVAQFQALARHLAPFRPAHGDLAYGEYDKCQGAGEPPTDFPSRGVVWVGADGSRRTLSFNTGCNVPAVGAALARVPDMLPIGDYIGARR